MSETQVEGAAAIQWLSRAPEADWSALIGCLVDDGRSEAAWIIKGIAPQLLDAAPEDRPSAVKSRPWSWLGSGTLLVPHERRAVLSLIEKGRPADLVALDESKRHVRRHGFDPDRLASVQDLQLLDRVLHSAAPDSTLLPTAEDRWSVYDAVMRANQQRPALPYFRAWCQVVEQAAAGRHDAVGRLHLAVLLRHAGRPRDALDVTEVLDGRDHFIPTQQRFIGMLSCTRAACMLDMFEADRDGAWLAKAEQHLKRAWAIGQTEEANAAYRRWRQLKEAWASENPPSRTPLGPRRGQA